MNHQYTQLYCIAILAILKITIIASQLLCSYLYANPTYHVGFQCGYICGSDSMLHNWLLHSYNFIKINTNLIDSRHVAS